jgi:hypothetical protein
MIAKHQFGEIEFFFSKNRTLIGEYAKVRDEVYQEQFALPTAAIIHDDYDFQPSTDILIVKHHDRVIGGARIIFRLRGSDTLMPFEFEGFKLPDVLPGLGLDDKCYCEVDRTILFREYREGELGREIVRQSAYHAKVRGADFLFTVCPLVQARNYKLHCSSLGIHFDIRKDIEVPDRPAFNGKRMWLTVTDLKCPVPETSIFSREADKLKTSTA